MAVSETRTPDAHSDQVRVPGNRIADRNCQQKADFVHIQTIAERPQYPGQQHCDRYRIDDMPNIVNMVPPLPGDGLTCTFA